MKTTAIIFFSLLLLAFQPAFADKEGEQTVAQLIKLSGAQSQYKTMIRVLSRTMESRFNLVLRRSLKSKTIAPDKRNKAGEILKKGFAEFMDDYNKLLSSKLTWDNMVKDIYTPLYLKHFNLKELKELVAFYQSDTGRKFAKVAPSLIQEASKKVSSNYTRAISTDAKNLADKHVKKIAKELQPFISKKK